MIFPVTRGWRGAALVVGGGLVIVGALGVIAHCVSVESDIATRGAAFAPWLMLAGVLGLLLLVVARQWLGAVIGVVVVVAAGISQAPLYFGSGPDRSDDDLTLMSANIELGQADPAALVEQVRSRDVEILTILELTESSIGPLHDAGLDDLLPYSYLQPGEGGAGAGIYSRYPLSEGEWLQGHRLANLRAEVDIPAAGRHAVYALHPLPPYPMPSWRWATELSRLGERLATEPLPTVIGSDFNSTYDHREFRKLLAEPVGLINAAEHLGAGVVRTYPADRPYPALLAIDHILTRGGPEPTSLERVELVGSDHHGLVATIRL